MSNLNYNFIYILKFILLILMIFIFKLDKKANLQLNNNSNNSDIQFKDEKYFSLFVGLFFIFSTLSISITKFSLFCEIILTLLWIGSYLVFNIIKIKFGKKENTYNKENNNNNNNKNKKIAIIKIKTIKILKILYFYILPVFILFISILIPLITSKNKYLIYSSGYLISYLLICLILAFLSFITLNFIKLIYITIYNIFIIIKTKDKKSDKIKRFKFGFYYISLYALYALVLIME